jgi:hypothetical protein
MDLDWSTLKTTSGMSGTFLAGLRLSGAVALGGAQRAVGSGHAHQARPSQRPSHARGGRAAGWWERSAYAWTLLRSRSERGGGGLVLGIYWVLTGKQSAARGPAIGRSTRRLGGALGFGEARVGGIRWRGTWSAARGHPVDHLRVVAACLLTCQHPGKGLGCSVGHRHGEDPPGVPTAARARHSRHGRPHRHLLLETAAVAAAILVGGHSVLQGTTVGGVGPELGSMPTPPCRQGGRAILSAS